MPSISKPLSSSPLPERLSSSSPSRTAGHGPVPASLDGFTAMSARRLYVFGGIALVAAGLLFGDIFAVFILHQNAGRQGELLIMASRALAASEENAGSSLHHRRYSFARRHFSDSLRWPRWQPIRNNRMGERAG